MIAEIDKITNRLTEELEFRFKEFERTVITNANYKEQADLILDSTSGYAQHLEHDTREMARLQKAIKDEIEKIRNDKNPERIIKDSIHYDLVDLYRQYIHLADDALSFNPVLFPPLKSMVRTGGELVDAANHLSIFKDFDSSVTKSIERHAQYIQKDIDKLMVKDTATDAEILSLKERLMAIELKLENGVAQMPAPIQAIPIAIPDERLEEESSPKRTVNPRMSDEELDAKDRKNRKLIDTFANEGTLNKKYQAAVPNAIGNSNDHPDDKAILVLRAESYKDGLDSFPAVENETDEE